MWSHASVCLGGELRCQGQSVQVRVFRLRPAELQIRSVRLASPPHKSLLRRRSEASLRCSHRRCSSRVLNCAARPKLRLPIRLQHALKFRRHFRDLLGVGSPQHFFQTHPPLPPVSSTKHFFPPTLHFLKPHPECPLTLHQ